LQELLEVAKRARSPGCMKLLLAIFRDPSTSHFEDALADWVNLIGKERKGYIHMSIVYVCVYMYKFCS
jgi:hypothetical protein